MPELPEVELVARAVGAVVSGGKIVAAELRRANLLRDATPEDFALALRGATFTQTARRGKHILLSFDRPVVLLVHLRMTGRFLYLTPEHEEPKHTHAVWYLDNEHRLVFVDPRQFGFMRLTTTDALAQTKELAALAPEPLSDAFTVKFLSETLRRSRRAIKETLLDQTKVTGLGNIYAAEALFMAGINPQTVAADVPQIRVRRLHCAIVQVLREAVAHGSTMNVDPQNVEGSYYGGPYENHWRVYDRNGQPCPVCAEKIQRIVQSNRSTYFCSRCQKKREPAKHAKDAKNKRVPTKDTK